MKTLDLSDVRSPPPEIGEGYNLVVFGPPHDNCGHSTWGEIRNTVKRTAAEAWRVSRPGALMAIKWNTHSHKLGTILLLVQDYWEPLCANLRSSRGRHLTGNDTYWTMLRRRPERYLPQIMNKE